MASLIAQDPAAGLNITRYTGPVLPGGGDRTRYQITRLGPQAGGHITLTAAQMAALATLIDGLMDLL